MLERSQVLRPSTLLRAIAPIRRSAASAHYTASARQRHRARHPLQAQEAGRSRDEQGHSRDQTCAEGRALLRSLLRECSYFPEAHARAEIRRQITTRFRRHQHSTWSPHELDKDAKRRFDARRTLHKLQRANNGDSRAIRKILLLVYGRSGSRKHELLRPLLPIRPSNTDASEPINDEMITASSLSATESIHGRASAPLPIFTPQFKALVAQQNKKRFGAVHCFHPRHPGKLQPKIPALNSWFKPMPASRVKNMTKKWYATVLDAVLPPLPPAEWLHIFDIASGAIEVLQPRRRSSLRVDRPSALELVALKGKIQNINMLPKRDSPITPKSLRRAWMEVFVACPVMLWDQSKQDWMIYWGDEAVANHYIADRVRKEMSRR